MPNEIDEKLFKQIFGHKLLKLADKLINTTKEKENNIIVKNINANKVKLDKQKKRPLMNISSNQLIDVLI